MHIASSQPASPQNPHQHPIHWHRKLLLAYPPSLLHQPEQIYPKKQRETKNPQPRAHISAPPPPPPHQHHSVSVPWTHSQAWCSHLAPLQKGLWDTSVPSPAPPSPKPIWGCCPPQTPSLYLCGTAWVGGMQGCAIGGKVQLRVLILSSFFLSFLFFFRRKRTYLGKAGQKPASFGGRRCRKEEVLWVLQLLTLRIPETAWLLS